MDRAEFSKLLVEAKESREVTRKYLAEQCKVSVTSIKGIEESSLSYSFDFACRYLSSVGYAIEAYFGEHRSTITTYGSFVNYISVFLKQASATKIASYIGCSFVTISKIKADSAIRVDIALRLFDYFNIDIKIVERSAVLAPQPLKLSKIERTQLNLPSAPIMPVEEFTSKLVEARKSAGIKVSQLARLINRDENKLYYLELGRHNYNISTAFDYLQTVSQCAVMFDGKHHTEIKTLPRLIVYLIKRREKLGLNQQQLSKLIKTSSSVIYNFETQKTPIRINTLLKILSALNITIDIKPYDYENGK